MKSNLLTLIFIINTSCATDSDDTRNSSPSTPDSQNANQNPNPSTAPAQKQVELFPSKDLPNLQKVTADIWRGGHPTVAGVAQMQKGGIKTILSLKTYTLDQSELTEEENAAKAAGIKFIHFPMNGILEPSVQELQTTLQILLAPENYPIFVHCEHGSDRTGMVIATYRIKKEGWSIKKATEEMYLYGHSKLLSGWDEVLEDL